MQGDSITTLEVEWCALFNKIKPNYTNKELFCLTFHSLYVSFFPKSVKNIFVEKSLLVLVKSFWIFPQLKLPWQGQAVYLQNVPMMKAIIFADIILEPRNIVIYYSPLIKAIILSSPSSHLLWNPFLPHFPFISHHLIYFSFFHLNSLYVLFLTPFAH